MSTAKISYFENPEEARQFLENWNHQVQTLNGHFYGKEVVDTSFGKTVVWTNNPERTDLETLVFFPGARTCALFWDLDNELAPLRSKYRFYMVEVNGQPNLSDGHNPDMKNNELGVWATEIFQKFKIQNATIVTASFGGIIAMKLSLQSPALVKKLILMATPGLQGFSTSLKNLYYNILPMVFPSQKSLDKFLNNAILHPPHHTVPQPYYRLMSEYLLYVLKHHKFKGAYPAPLRKEELQRLRADTYIVAGDKDLLYPPAGTAKAARNHIQSLKEVIVLPGVAHGIETYKGSINVLEDILKRK